MAAPAPAASESFFAVVRDDGRSSKKVTVTKACKSLGLAAGSYVWVTVSPVRNLATGMPATTAEGTLLDEDAAAYGAPKEARP